LGYFGTQLGQDEIGAALRTNPDDKNVNPEELAEYARRQGYTAHVLVNGTSERLRLLLSNGLPVLVETWLEDEPNNGMGHYRLLTGYDDARAEWIAFDSYEQHGLRNADPTGPYAGIAIPYNQFEQLWKVFNRTYIVVYPADQAVIADSILGDEIDVGSMWSSALDTAQHEIAAQPDDAFAWFNLGSDLVALDRFAEAADAYDHARRLGLPWRMLWYQFGPFHAYQQSGRYQEVVALAEATLATTTSVEELFYWRGQGMAALGDVTTAREAWQQALALNPHYTDAAAALGQ
jgi:tetratricopeptide (TPR) repeat protein